MGRKIRLYLKNPMKKGQDLLLEASQAHYLFSVMRQRSGDKIFVFNGRDGEFSATINALSKRNGKLILTRKTRPLLPPSDLWLIFAPIKKERTDFIVEKATELGVGRLLPMRSALTNTRRINHARLNAHIIEAAEQCGATVLPELEAFQDLPAILDALTPERHLLFCDETLAGAGGSFTPPKGPAALLIGPEAGFSESERARVRTHPNSAPLSLGPRILRADTAAVAALALWQAHCGDWYPKKRLNQVSA